MPKDQYKTTIGLEIHAELKTKTKMFCGSLHDTDEERPNVNICPVCMGHPGTLPMINKEAVKHVLRVGVAVGGTLADYTEFDRKNYFYPDIPKGYQISQYKYPLVTGGSIKGVQITRVHLEEDTAKSQHGDNGASLVNFNRAGAPLMELVTEPVIHSGEEASAFARELQLILQYLGVSDANMEKGEMRVEANISVSKTEKFGTKVEVKNLNSFKAVEKAVAFEVERHIDILEEGGKIVQETRGWDENKGTTFSQRAKEDSHDYRYFPDPDLPKLRISEIPELSVDALKKTIPELPNQKRERLLVLGLGLGTTEIETLIGKPILSRVFDDAVMGSDKEVSKVIAGVVITEIPSFVEGEDFGKLSGKRIADIAKLKVAGTISSKGVKDVLRVAYKEDGDIESLAKKIGVIQESNTGALEEIAKKVIEANPKVSAEFKAGKTASLQFLIGQAMKESKGSANPGLMKGIFEKLLSN